MLIALAALIFEIHQSVQQSKMHTFLTYSERYQQVMLNLPSTVRDKTFLIASLNAAERERALRWFRTYFDMCSEEHYLHSVKLIDNKVWSLWSQGISDSLQKPAFVQAWRIVSETNTYDPVFARFIEAHISEK